MKNFMVLLAAIVVATVASTSFADIVNGTSTDFYAHDHFSMIAIKGDAAKEIYDHLATPAKEDVTGSGQHLGTFSKISQDGRMACQKTPAGVPYNGSMAEGINSPDASGEIYKCDITFDSNSGKIDQTFTQPVNRRPGIM